MNNRKNTVQRYLSWKRNVAATSMFVVVCGFVAAVYFFYRIVLIALPAAEIKQSVLSSSANARIVCQQDIGGDFKDPLPSAAYQSRIQHQKPVTTNMVANADLARIDAETGSPTNFSHSIDDDGASYQYFTDPANGARFLHVVNAQERGKDQVSPAWQMDPIPISTDRKTYAYSFWYRSTVPLKVSIDYTVSGRIQYKDITTLDATGASWQQFTSHFDNTDKASNLRIDVDPLGIGQVDSRGFDVHQIADARLSEGIVSVTFDDGWKSVSEQASHLFEKYNIPTTQYIISETAEHNVAGYMTYADIEKLKKSGHEIGSHSLNHCNQTELPADVLKNNAIKSKQELDQKNLGPVKTFAYPLGKYNKKTQAIYEKQYSLIRTSDVGYNDHYYDETNVRSMAVLSNTSDKILKMWLSYAKTNHVWVVLTYHRVDESGEYSVTSKRLEQQLKIIHESGLSVMTMSEAASAARK